MSRLVPDASIAVKWYVPEIHSEAAARLLDPSHELHGPDLILPEVGNVIWKKIRRREISAGKGREIIRAFLKAPLVKHEGSALIEAAYEAAYGTGQTVYDCMYLALAVSLGARMVTADKKFYEATRRGPLGRFVVWVEDVAVSAEKFKG